LAGWPKGGCLKGRLSEQSGVIEHRFDTTSPRRFHSGMALNSAGTTSPYLLLFRNGGPEAHAHLTTPERDALTQQWNAWFDRLSKRGMVEQGRPLGLGGRVVSEPQGTRVTDGPYAEAKEVVAGYFMIRATSLDEATEIAKGCPGLAIGLTVEVRPVVEFSPVLQQVRGSGPRHAPSEADAR